MYQIRSYDEEVDELVAVVGVRHFSERGMERGLETIPDMPFPTLGRHVENHCHIVVNIDDIDIHIMGGLSFTAGLQAARNLSGVKPSDIE